MPSLEGPAPQFALGPYIVRAATIFLSAFLLFQIQPLLAKAILPWFGGSSAVWTACLLFFQAALLAGYLYAFALDRLIAPRRQPFIHAFLLAASLLLLPIIPAAQWKPAGPQDPLWRILGLLTATAGLPYLLLSATSPLLQSWLAHQNAGKTSYRLFSLSNLGSMLGLLTFPFLFEPNLTGRQQALAWSGAYGVFAVLCTLEAFRMWRTAPAPSDALPINHSATLKSEVVLWAALAAGASALLLAATNHISQNIAAIPLIWIVPLSLYLLSFVLCFAGYAWYRRRLFIPLFALTGAAMAYALFSSHSGPYNGNFRLLVALYSFSLFIWCMVLHGELARRRPAARDLTLYYLALSAGGVSGGLLVAWLSPRIFRTDLEFPLLIALCPLLVAIALRRSGAPRLQHRLTWAAAALLLFTTWGYMAYHTWKATSGAIFETRNFYGSLEVRDLPPRTTGVIRMFSHGSTVHGEEFLRPDRQRIPTTYYGVDSGIGRAFHALRGPDATPLSIGLVGLGAGTLTAYSHPGDRLRYYEINPLVVEIARSQFFFLRNSGAPIQIVMGDARLSLEREAPQGFDLLAIDAFSSDAIPVHLLTREALSLYIRHLKTDGVLALHLSNRHVDLTPIATLGLQSLGLSTECIENPAYNPDGVYLSTWILASARPNFFIQPALEHAGIPVEPSPALRVWTDDYSSLWPLLR